MQLYGLGRSASVLFVMVLFFDQLSKWLTDHYLPMMNQSAPFYPYGGIGVFDNVLGIEFSISHLTNFGAAWGAFADFQVYLLALRIILIVALAYYTLLLNTQSGWVYPLALVMAGAIGNVIDYFMYGHVVDMIHFIFWGYDYPVFNLADSAVFIGVAWIGCTALWPALHRSSSARH